MEYCPLNALQMYQMFSSLCAKQSYNQQKSLYGWAVATAGQNKFWNNSNLAGFLCIGSMSTFFFFDKISIPFFYLPLMQSELYTFSAIFFSDLYLSINKHKFTEKHKKRSKTRNTKIISWFARIVHLKKSNLKIGSRWILDSFSYRVDFWIVRITQKLEP